MRLSRPWMLALALVAPLAQAQQVVRQDEFLAPDRPEAWAMNRAAAVSLMTPFGELPQWAPGQWDLAVDLGEVPQLDAAEQRVGFNGNKFEDLNKTPVFGRLRARLGLPGGWIAELGYTPPVTINGARPRDLVALSLGRRVFERGAFTLSGRVFGQHGTVEGDITCPAELAGVSDSELNPYGCQAASNDRISLNDYGLDLTAGWNARQWHWHGSAGVVRTELQAQVDAITFDVRDRSRLVANDTLRYAALGVRRDLGTHWSVGAELLHVPLDVRRGPDASSEREPLTSVRLQLRYTR
jgi:hypothetical protein